MSGIGKSVVTESRLVVASDRGRGSREGIANGYVISFWGDENVLKLIVVIVAQLCEYTKNH